MADGRLLPNWIKAYLAYTNESESPEEYHLWCAISTIAGVLRRRVRFDMGYFQVYPNLFVVLVAPPGRCKKSTAMRISRRMLGRVDGINFTTDSISRERLIQDMSQSAVDGHSSMTAYSSEFASLLTTSGMDMVVFLTDIYDSPEEWAHKTKMGGINKIVGPYLNLIGGTTPDWIARSLPLDTVGIGLTSRVLFVYQDTPRIRPSRPKLTAEQLQLEVLLAEDLRAISTLEGEYIMSPEAEVAYEEWYQAKLINPNPTNDGRLNGYFERKHIHTLKVAMIIAASQRNDRTITLTDLQTTWALLEKTEERMPDVFAAVGKNVLGFDLFEILKLVGSRPAGISDRELMGRFIHNVRKDEMDEILATLVQMGKIAIDVSPGKRMIRLPAD